MNKHLVLKLAIFSALLGSLLGSLLAAPRFAHAGRVDASKTEVRTADDANREGKVRCVHFERAQSSAIDANDIELETEKCFYTKEDFAIYRQAFLESLRQSLDNKSVTGDTPIQEIRTQDGFNQPRLNQSLRTLSSKFAQDQKCQTDISKVDLGLPRDEDARVRSLMKQTARGLTCR